MKELIIIDVKLVKKLIILVFVLIVLKMEIMKVMITLFKEVYLEEVVIVEEVQLGKRKGFVHVMEKNLQEIWLMLHQNPSKIHTIKI